MEQIIPDPDIRKVNIVECNDSEREGVGKNFKMLGGQMYGVEGNVLRIVKNVKYPMLINTSQRKQNLIILLLLAIYCSLLSIFPILTNAIISRSFSLSYLILKGRYLCFKLFYLLANSGKLGFRTLTFIVFSNC